MDYQALSNMSITELKQLLSCVNQDIKSIKRRDNAAKKQLLIMLYPSWLNVILSLSALLVRYTLNQSKMRS